MAKDRFLIELGFDCPLKKQCNRKATKELCGEKMQVKIFKREGEVNACWSAFQPFCDKWPLREEVIALLRQSLYLKTEPEKK